MSRRVYLHVGAPKTGTTYLQDRLTLNADTLAGHGVHFPTRSPLVSPALFQFRAALDLLGREWGAAAGDTTGSWEALVKRVRRRTGTVVISHEILAPARPEQVARAMDDLAGAEIHVVYTARDYSRVLPAAWQESIKQGRRWPYAKFLRKSRRGKTWFSRAFDLPSVLGTWGAGLPPERVHVVTVPKSRDATPGGTDPLWSRFCSVVGIDPAWAPHESTRTNQSLGVAESQVIRQLNSRLDRGTDHQAEYDVLIRQLLAQERLVEKPSPPVRLPPRAYGWVTEASERWLEYLEQSGVDVVGDPEDLRPPPVDPEAEWDDPDKVAARKRLRVALDALAAMTQEAADRPDPDRQLSRRIKQRAARLRGS
jgi:hypothetical protein